MSIFAVNGRDYEAEAGLKTWGQLLNVLEEGVGTEHAVVTAVRFGGVDQPSFREPDLLSRDLSAGACIDIDTCPAQLLVAEAAEAALNGLGPLGHAVQQAADAFRGFDISDAHSRLSDIVATLHALTQLTAAASEAAASPRAAGDAEDSAKLLSRLGQSLEALVAAATSQDWISVADVLEYDMTDLLPSWQAVLRALANPKSGANAGCGLPVTVRCAS